MSYRIYCKWRLTGRTEATHTRPWRSGLIFSFPMGSQTGTFIWMEQAQGHKNGEVLGDVKECKWSNAPGVRRESGVDEKWEEGLGNKRWWSMALRPCQCGPTFNTVVRSKYTYGLIFLERSVKRIKADDEWSDMERRALLQRKAKIHDTARAKLNALLQWKTWRDWWRKRRGV